MTEQEQIEQMARITCQMYCRQYEKRCAGVGECDYKCLHYQRCEVLYATGYHKQSEWISVEDRLPEKSGTYLVHYHDDIIGEYVITREYWEKQRKFAPMEYFEEHTGRKVMHWMPLPEPPTEKED